MPTGRWLKILPLEGLKHSWPLGTRFMGLERPVTFLPITTASISLGHAMNDATSTLFKAHSSLVLRMQVWERGLSLWKDLCAERSCFYAFCWSAIPTSRYTFNVYLCHFFLAADHLQMHAWAEVFHLSQSSKYILLCSVGWRIIDCSVENAAVLCKNHCESHTNLN